MTDCVCLRSETCDIDFHLLSTCGRCRHGYLCSTASLKPRYVYLDFSYNRLVFYDSLLVGVRTVLSLVTPHLVDFLVC